MIVQRVIGPPTVVDPLFASIIQELRSDLNLLSSRELLANWISAGIPPTILVNLSDSPELAGRSTYISPDCYEITLPMGLLYRVYIVCRQLLYYWNDTFKVALLNTPLDPIVPDLYHWPPRAAIFLANFSDWPSYKSEFNAIEDQLEQNFPLSHGNRLDCLSTAYHSMLFAFLHELAHCVEAHIPLLDDKDRIWKGTFPDLGRAMETRADSVAGMLAMRFYLLIEQSNPGAGDIRQAWIRFVAGTLILFAIFDVNRNCLANYQDGNYEHPDIRFNTVMAMASEILHNQLPEAIGEWDNIQHTVYGKVQNAFANLTLEIGSEKYSKIHGLTVGLYAASVLQDRANEARASADRLVADLNALSKQGTGDAPRRPRGKRLK